MPSVLSAWTAHSLSIISGEAHAAATKPVVTGAEDERSEPRQGWNHLPDGR
jgi:hypothetical protein